MIFPAAGLRGKWESWCHLMVNNDSIIEIVIVVVIAIIGDISFSVLIVIHTLSRPNSMPYIGIEKLMPCGNRRKGLGLALVAYWTLFKD